MSEILVDGGCWMMQIIIISSDKTDFNLIVLQVSILNIWTLTIVYENTSQTTNHDVRITPLRLLFI